tara:strand:+ start:224 stop:820 length:597 start_codon:yes stop_codon:yes gene_type:complete
MSKIKKDEFVKHQIIEASKVVFKNYGFKKANMELIAKASGKGRSTLYYYFENKDAVFKAFCEDFYEDMLEVIFKQLSPNLTIEKNLNLYTQGRLNQLIVALDTYENLLADIKSDTKFMVHLFRKIKDEEIEIIKNCLLWAIEKNEIKPIASEKLHFLSVAIVTSAGSIEKEIFLYETVKGDPKEQLQWITQLMINSLK